MAGEESPSHLQHLQQQQQQLLHQQQHWVNLFWDRQRAEIESQEDFKTHQLPLARIKKIMKTEEEVRMISAEAPVLFAKAAELFILELTLRSWIHTEENKRRTLQRSDIATAVQKTDTFDFLIDIVPRDEARPVLLGTGRAPPAAALPPAAKLPDDILRSGAPLSVPPELYAQLHAHHDPQALRLQMLVQHSLAGHTATPTTAAAAAAVILPPLHHVPSPHPHAHAHPLSHAATHPHHAMPGATDPQHHHHV